jgi:WD40 repeat protein
VRAWSLGPKAEAADLPVDRHTQFVFNEGYRMAESADGRRLFAGSFLGWGEVWELPSLRPLFNPRTGATPKTGAVVSAETPFGALSRDGARLIVTENGFPEARVFDATTGTVVLALEDPGSDLVRAEINPAGGGYLTLDAKGRISLWDAAGRVLGRANESGPKINEVHFSQDGAFIAAACEDGKARVWRIPSMELAWTGAGAGDGTHLPEVSPVTFGNRYPRRGMTCVGISPDGTLVAAGNDVGAVMVWETSSGRQLELFWGHAGPVNAVAFDRVGRRVASASDDWTARIWDLSLEGQPAEAIASLLSKVAAEAPQAQPTGPGK